MKCVKKSSEDTILELRDKGTLVVLTGVQEQPFEMMERIELIGGAIPEEHVFKDVQACEQWLEKALASHEPTRKAV